MKTASPDRIVTRPATPKDAERVSVLINDRIAALRGRRPETAERVRHRWSHPRFDPSTDSRLVFAPDGTLIGYAHIRDVKDPPVDVFGGFAVHPAHDRASWLWDDLFGWMESEARRVILKAPPDARIALVAGTTRDDVVEQRELESHGFQYSRTFHRMAIDFCASVAVPSPPGCFRIRTVLAGQDDEGIVVAYQAAFADHYGVLKQPFEVELADWRRLMEEDDFDPALWFVAERNGEIVGFVTGYAQAPGDPGRGLIDDLGVRPGWRRRGLGHSLLLYAFRALADRGASGAVLAVDTENRTGAPALYERAGMRSIRASYSCVKELRPGRDFVGT